jgi:hypothetical protein
MLFFGDSELFFGVLNLFNLPLDLRKGTGVQVGGLLLLVLELDWVVLFEQDVDGDI